MLPTSWRDMAWLRAQVAAVAGSVWGALTQPAAAGAGCARGGGAGGAARARRGRFRPDLIVANQLAYGQAHCAEALGAPLHMIYTVSARHARLLGRRRAWRVRGRLGPTRWRRASGPQRASRVLRLITACMRRPRRTPAADPLGADGRAAAPLGARVGRVAVRVGGRWRAARARAARAAASRSAARARRRRPRRRSRACGRAPTWRAPTSSTTPRGAGSCM